jgi:hypothetical protein
LLCVIIHIVWNAVVHEYLNSELMAEKDKVLGQIGDCENKLSTFMLRLEQLDTSKTNTISLLSELTMMIEDLDITEGEERRDLLDEMVDKVVMNHDGNQHIISVHYKLGIGVINYKK